VNAGATRAVATEPPLPQADAPIADEDPDKANESRVLAEDDPSFGPEITIERIVVKGNDKTAEKLIRRALLLREGDRLRSGDPRLRTSRIRVLALGYFADVGLALSRGTQRGHVVVTVTVVERGTFTLDRLYFGTSEATPLWLGLDVGDGNLWGSGIGAGVAVLWSDAAALDGADEQRALRLRVHDPHLLGAPLGVRLVLLYNDASEPYRRASGDDTPQNFGAFHYRRIGGLVGASADLTRLSSVLLDVRVEAVRADGPIGEGALLEPGRSVHSTVTAGFVRDTRVDAVLPYAGDRALLIGEVAFADYRSLKLQAGYERFFSLVGRTQVLAIRGTVGTILGDPPVFDLYYVGDLNPLLPPRMLDLVMSTRAPPDFLDTGVDSTRYGRFAATAGVEYSYRLFRRTKHIYGGDLFTGVGAYLLTQTSDLDTRVEDDAGRWPVGLSFNVGLRLDTEVGIFELSLANGLGRIPF
jgi:outer membrane protein assembly factor BamA